MKNRLLFLVSLFALSLCTWVVHAFNTVPVSTPIQKSDIEEPPPEYENANERPINWTINCLRFQLNHTWSVFYHQLHVEYGRLIADNPIGDL